ncbi:hypothetical protein PR048_031886 [Dryococelus australis]|uniref:Uncharacterized protein n=1 Tax=Dryococelus australis TaxID=614101 RepID=A0ABQ9G9C5_9NEOP|nr:hypothetical protein PR048_031886 [Dryococelus australis]
MMCSTLKSKLLCVVDLLLPVAINKSRLYKKREEIRKKQVCCYDKGAIALDPLNAGEVMYFKINFIDSRAAWRSGNIVEFIPHRSHLIKDSSGRQVRRNRKFIRRRSSRNLHKRSDSDDAEVRKWGRSAISIPNDLLPKPSAPIMGGNVNDTVSSPAPCGNQPIRPCYAVWHSHGVGPCTTMGGAYAISAGGVVFRSHNMILCCPMCDGRWSVHHLYRWCDIEMVSPHVRRCVVHAPSLQVV